jgi:hypothetical protein
MAYIFTPGRFPRRMKAKGKTHMCFPNRSINRPGAALQAISSTPNLTLAMSAAIALAATLFIHQGITPTLRAEIASYA